MKLNVTMTLDGEKLESAIAIPAGKEGAEPAKHVVANAVLQAASQQMNMATSGEARFEGLSIEVIR